MAPHSSTLAWRIPCTEEPGGLQSMGHKELDTTGRQHAHTHEWEHADTAPRSPEAPCLKHGQFVAHSGD